MHHLKVNRQGFPSPTEEGSGGGYCTSSPEIFFNFYPEMARFFAFCNSNFGGKRMSDVEYGQWDFFYPNLRLKIIFFSKWLNCAVSFI